MQFDIKGVHYNVSDHTREFVQEKLLHLERFADLLVNLEFQITKDAHGFEVSVNVHFRWGENAHITETGIDLFPVIDVVVEKLDHKISKEKEKIKDHHH